MVGNIDNNVINVNRGIPMSNFDTQWRGDGSESPQFIRDIHVGSEREEMLKPEVPR
jgi:hypothetical protein